MPFWTLATAQRFKLLKSAVHSHGITSQRGSPLTVERNAGLIVEVTDGDTVGFQRNLSFDLAKNAVVRLTYAMAAGLRARDVTALGITRGNLGSEAMLDTWGVTEGNWPGASE